MRAVMAAWPGAARDMQSLPAELAQLLCAGPQSRMDTLPSPHRSRAPAVCCGSQTGSGLLLAQRLMAKHTDCCRSTPKSSHLCISPQAPYLEPKHPQANTNPAQSVQRTLVGDSSTEPSLGSFQRPPKHCWLSPLSPVTKKLSYLMPWASCRHCKPPASLASLLSASYCFEEHDVNHRTNTWKNFWKYCFLNWFTCAGLFITIYI